MHDAPLLTTIAVGLLLAFVLGAAANRLRMPPLVGYLLAGVVVGPFTPGFVADAELANELSEIGVILLMFGVGLHFSLKDLLSVQAVAVPGALLRIAGGTALGTGMGLLLGWPLGGALIFGLALSVASTVVLLKALQDRHLLDSDRGRIAIGWVIVEDIAMVLALVLIPALAGLLGGTATEVSDPFVNLFERFTGIELELWGIIGITVVKLLAFVGFMLVVGRRVIPWVLHLTAHTGSRELFRLAVLAIALGVAAGAAYLFGVSLALGAFFAGMILSESELSNRAAQESLPFRDAFAVLFFVSVGMLFDPAILWTRPWEVIGTLFIILVGKTVLGYFLIVALRRPPSVALTISASLAQIGEFSFILAALGLSLGLLPPEGQSLIVAGAIISIVVNPLLMYAAESMRPQLEARAVASQKIVVPDRVEPSMSESAPAPEAEIHDDRTPTALTGHTVLIGYGRVGGVIAEGLKRQGTPFVLIEDSEKRLAAAHKAGIEVVVGNAATSRSLALANIENAVSLIVAIPNAFEAGQAVEQSRKLNPGLMIVARAHSDEEVTYLRDLGANEVIMGEREIGLGMLGWTNGDNARAAEAERARANLEAVAAALRVDELPVRPMASPPPIEPAAPPPRPAPPPPPAIPVEELEAAIEASHPEHVPEGPAEPPELVPAYGEMPVEDEAGPPPAYVMDGDMGPHEPIVEAPVSFFIPEPKELEAPDDPEPAFEPEPVYDTEGEPVSDTEAESEPEPEEEDLPYIDVHFVEEFDEPPGEEASESVVPDVQPEPPSPTVPKAGGPASAPGVPYKPEVEPAAD
jgi:CPA2 family monovalent cation:H+ antiporter-2